MLYSSGRHARNCCVVQLLSPNRQVPTRVLFEKWLTLLSLRASEGRVACWGLPRTLGGSIAKADTPAEIVAGHRGQSLAPLKLPPETHTLPSIELCGLTANQQAYPHRVYQCNFFLIKPCIMSRLLPSGVSSYSCPKGSFASRNPCGLSPTIVKDTRLGPSPWLPCACEA